MRLLIFRLKCLRACLESRVGLFPLECVDRALDRLLLGLERRYRCLFAAFFRRKLTAKRRLRRFAGIAFTSDAFEIYDRDDGAGDRLRRGGGGRRIAAATAAETRRVFIRIAFLR